MANVLINKTAQISHLGGGTTLDNLLKGDGSTAYVQGQWVYGVGGVATPVSATAAVLSSGTDAFAAGFSRYIVVTASAATTDYIEVQEVTLDTVFEAEVVDAVASDILMDQTDVNKVYCLYQDSSGRIAVDNLVTNGIAKIYKVEPVMYPFTDTTLGKDSGGDRHTRVQFTLLNTLFN